MHVKRCESLSSYRLFNVKVELIALTQAEALKLQTKVNEIDEKIQVSYFGELLE